MLDGNNRVVDYLRVSVTEKCNLRCRYCMPAEGVEDIGHQRVLTLEQIFRLVKVGTRVGIRKVRLTGGEPLVRKNITKLVEDIASLPEIDDVSITTNGILFGRMAEELKAAGLSRVNISLDSLKPERLRYITRGAELNDVLTAVDKALKLDLNPVKLNVVVIKGFNDDEVLDFVRLAYEKPLHVRFIEFMPIGDISFYSEDKCITNAEVQKRVEQHYRLVPGKRVTGNGPAQCYQLEGGQGSVGFISAMSNHFCAHCNRIRLTADGHLRSCLYHNKEIDTRLALLNCESDEHLVRLFRKAIETKPRRHEMQNGWGADNERKMFQIGG